MHVILKALSIVLTSYHKAPFCTASHGHGRGLKANVLISSFIII